MSWAEKYINTRHKNCWTFVREVYLNELGIKLPEFATIFIGDVASIVRTMKVESESPHWQKVEEPHEFAIVAMSKSQYIHHVGVWTNQDRGKVIHTYEQDPVVANNKLQLKRMGFQRIEFYEFCKDSRNL